MQYPTKYFCNEYSAMKGEFLVIAHSILCLKDLFPNHKQKLPKQTNSKELTEHTKQQVSK